jgi:enolase
LNSRISKIQAREILDSRGNPTIEVDVELVSGYMGRMMVPSGASTGIYEAWELRDEDQQRYRGKGVRKAVENVNTEIASLLLGENAEDQEKVDKLMIELDGTANKSRLGANAILGVSLAVAHATAAGQRLPLYRYLANRYLERPQDIRIPMPMINIISGGLHAGKNIDFQDFMVMPLSAQNIIQALEMVSIVYWNTKKLIEDRGGIASLLADEGGFGPPLSSNKEALELLMRAIEMSGLRPMEDIAIAVDVASSHFYDRKKQHYALQSEERILDSDQLIDLFEGWIKKYPIISIEDGLAEDDWSGWKRMTQRIGKVVELVGDDFFTTNPERIRRGISEGAANSVLIKMNQIGTLTETAQAVKIAKAAKFKTVISARSGETEDCTLSDLAVGLSGGQIKIGSLARSSRLSKYNQLLRISEQIDHQFVGRSVFNR